MKDIERGIQQGIKKLAPNILPQVLSSDAVRLEHADWEFEILPHKKSLSIYRTLSILAACFVLVMGFNFYSQNIAADSTIDLDVNPSIELTTNKKDIVIDSRALNEEGKQILEGMSLKKVEVNTAMNAIIGSMVKHGYLQGTNNSILISVQNKDTRHARKLEEDITGDIKEALNVNRVSGAVYHQYIDDNYTDIVEGTAGQYGISRGKAAFILKLIEKDSTLTAEELASLSLKQIALIIKERNIDISDLMGYESDDSISENVEEIVEENDENIDSTQGKSNPDQNYNTENIGEREDDDDWDEEDQADVLYENYDDLDDKDDEEDDEDRDDGDTYDDQDDWDDDDWDEDDRDD